MADKKFLIIILILLVAAGAAVGYYFFIMKAKTPVITPIERETTGLGGTLYENPGQEVPEVNSFKNVKVNPIEGTNPFEGIYKNPFQ